MKYGDVESHQSPGCLIAGVQGLNLGWGCSTRGGSLARIGLGHVVKKAHKHTMSGNCTEIIKIKSNL